MENKLKMEDNPSYYQELISKYFAGEASPDEIQLLSVWLSSDIQHQVLFTEQAKTWQAIENIKIENAIDIDAEWNAFSERIAEAPEQKVYSSEKKKEKRFNLFAAIRIAAPAKKSEMAAGSIGLMPLSIRWNCLAREMSIRR